MAHFALSAVGRDRPGIVAAVTEVLVARSANVEDSQMAILQGHFTMMLVVSAPAEVDERALHADLERVRERLGLESVSLAPVAGLHEAARPAPTHVVSVYGADHPGIVHAVARALADRQITITDLRTQLAGAEGDAPSLYAMLLEVQLPRGGDEAELEDALGPVRGEQGVEVTVRPLERDTL